jgi:hypothetical protein
MLIGNQLLTYITSYLLVFLLGFFLLNFLTRGFILKFILVKASKGKKVLVAVYSRSHIYHKTGKFEEGTLIYKDLAKKTKRIPNVPKDSVYIFMGVSCVDVDDEKNATIDRINFKAIEGYDAVKVDSLITRALMLPHIEDKKEFIIILVLLILILFGVGAGVFLTLKTQKLIIALGQIAGNV